MGRGARGASRFGIIAVAAAIALSGCSSSALTGKSAWGGNKLSVADVSNIGDYTADRALSEARSHFRNSDFGHSATFYKRVVELTPKDPEGYVGLGASYDRLRRFDLSDRVYASLYELSGGTVQYYNNVGYSYMLRGKFSEAMTYFRKAEKLEPGNVVVTNNLQILANAAAKARAA
jgi:Flp pilus assembly protein TadD